MRLTAWVVLALLIASCSSPTPAPRATPIATVTPPPRVLLGGVEGQAWSWCWANACVDGTPSPDGPLVSEATSLLFDLPPVGAQVYFRRGWPQVVAQEAVAVTDGKIESVPPGDWDYLVAEVRYEEGSAAYVWRLR